MDSYREFPTDFEPSSEADAPDSPQQSVTCAIGTDERRMHVRAYNYWVSLLDGRDYPCIEDLEPGDLVDFAPHSVLLDFTNGGDSPATPYIGTAIREECDIQGDIRTIDDVPSRSLLSRLTDHYMQIIANRAPIGFEAEFVNQRGDTLCYRGILMPFSSDGDTIDFIYGVINWKKLDETQDRSPAPSPVEAAAEPQGEQEDAAELEMSEIELGKDAGLADRLWAARECAEALKAAEGRSRAALYRALAFAYDFALSSKQSPADYAELLEESGMKAQARAPMTPVVKLVFGIDYAKARLTEYAAALSYAERQEVEFGGFLAFIEAQAGGLKALVFAERAERRPGPKADTRTAKAVEQLRVAPSMSLGDIPADEEFALVLTRRSGDGSHQPVAIVNDQALLERAIRRAAG